jgi:hypothetical protein
MGRTDWRTAPFAWQRRRRLCLTAALPRLRLRLSGALRLVVSGQSALAAHQRGGREAAKVLRLPESKERVVALVDRAHLPIHSPLRRAM